MKIFISQKMRGKTHEEIIKERNAILNGYLLHGNPDAKTKKEIDEFKKRLFDMEIFVKKAIEKITVDDVIIELLPSYKPELAFKDPIPSLSQSLLMLAEADIVLVPKIAIGNSMQNVELDWESHFDGDHWFNKLSVDGIKENLKGCEFEFLIALSYGKKVYTYDDKYNFEEVK